MKKKPITKSKRKPPVKAIMDQFEISLVRLLKSASELKISENIRPPFSTNIEFKVELAEGPKHKIALVNVSCLATLKPTNGAANLDGTQVSVMFQVVFKAKENFPTLSDDDRRSMVMDGCVIAWPYIRSHIQATFSTMGLPPVVLPLNHP